jgi:hypothetical protein
VRQPCELAHPPRRPPHPFPGDPGRFKIGSPP